jgi:hypothetical protein
MDDGSGMGNDPVPDGALNFSAGDWMAFAKSDNSGGLAASDGALELMLSSSVEENKMGCPCVRLARWASAGNAAASATPARSSHRVKYAKLKPISNCQANSLDNPRQK